jgi:hypothetical protein
MKNSSLILPRESHSRRLGLAFGFAAISAFSALAPGAHAYEPSTHAIISRAAALESRIYQGDSSLPLFTELGFGSPQTQQFGLPATDTFGAGPLAGATAVDLIALGAQNEDNLSVSTRVFNHFFDPQANGNQGRPLTISVVLGRTSPDWALEDRDPESVGTVGGQNFFSYSDAVSFLFDSQRASSRTQRTLAMGQVLLRLGHVIHHIQDMAQPQHTRNDAHGPPQRAAAFYERFTANEINPTLDAAILRPNPLPKASFDFARQFWSDHLEAYRGTADFSSRNYVSSGTNFRSATGFTVAVLPALNFPKPDGVNVPSGTNKTRRRMVFDVRLLSGRVVQMPMEYIVGDVFDGGSNATLSNPTPIVFHDKLLASTSLFDRVLESLLGPGFRTQSVDENVFRSNYGILLPRARSYSAGLIDHFFRGVGALRVERESDNRFTVTSPRFALLGALRLFFEDGAGVRTQVAIQSVRSASGSRFVFDLQQPLPGSGRLFAVFVGSIDTVFPNRLPALQDPLFREVATGTMAVVTQPPPPPPAPRCTESLMTNSNSQTGVSNTYIKTHFVGKTAGVIRGYLENFNDVDRSSYVIRAEGGNSPGVVFSSNGFVVSQREFSFNFDPVRFGGADTLRIQLETAQRDGSVFTLATGCPGEPKPR